MVTFLDLQNLIAFDLRGQLAVDTNITDQIKEEINNSIRFLNHELFWFNTRISYTITNPNQTMADYISLPLDYKALIADPSIINPDGTKRTLEHTSNEDIELINKDGQKSMPRYFTLIGDQLRIGPIPDKNYRIQIHYVRSYPVLVNDDDTNDWLDQAGTLIRYESDRKISALVLRDPQFFSLLNNIFNEELVSMRLKTLDYLSLEGIKPNDI